MCMWKDDGGVVSLGLAYGLSLCIKSKENKITNAGNRFSSLAKESSF